MKNILNFVIIGLTAGQTLHFKKSLSDAENKEETQLLEVRKQFPQYSNHFDEKAVQDKIYAEIEKLKKDHKSKGVKP